MLLIKQYFNTKLCSLNKQTNSQVGSLQRVPDPSQKETKHHTYSWRQFTQIIQPYFKLYSNMICCQKDRTKKKTFQERDEQHCITYRRTVVMMILSGLMMICTFDYWQNVGPLQEMALFKCPIWHNMTRGKSMNNSHPKGCVKRGKSVFRLKLHLLYALFHMSVIKPIF